ncbi:MAG TPA: hypothetical protein VE134_02495, partial [Methanomicrobiales archaeon]|nr:hypothetical protein [Methanomicrobiales archaeon]
MTARDMQAEQMYHADRLDTASRFVLGEGIVCGLEGTVKKDEETGGLTVTLQPGLALDCCGRQVVVESATTVKLDPPENDSVHLYLTYDECEKEPVPMTGSESACEDEGGYNRVLEIFEIEYGDEPKESYKVVPTIEFPDPDQNADTDLFKMAQSYYEIQEGDNTGSLRPCETCDDKSVFLGTFTKNKNEWERDQGVPRRFVYTNDMLYAAIARHVTDFDNPHWVSLATNE